MKEFLHESEVYMTKMFLFVPLLGFLLTGCETIHQTMWTLERNRQAIDASTAAIEENAQAIEETNRKIEENRHQLEAINKTLKKASES